MAPFQNSGSSDLSILIKKVFLPEVEKINRDQVVYISHNQ